jgi:DNA-directed RNA polymerase subunit K/omega
MSAFEFSVLSSLRAAQLSRGCTPRVPPSEKHAVTAQHEVAEYKVIRSTDVIEPVS